MAERVLVTGAGGFLGSHICQYFGARGDAIGAVGRFSGPLGANESYPNLQMFWGMTLPDWQLAPVFKAFQPTLVVHAAGTASVGTSVENPYQDFQRTVEVCAFTLEMVRLHAPTARFVLLSSASVYGDQGTLPVPESANPQPVSPYGYHKRLCELLVEEYSQLHGLQCLILRIFSAFGERLRKQVLYDLCCRAASPNTDTIEVFGTGEETRDFVHARDVAQAIHCLHEAKVQGSFNVASGTQTAISEAALLIATHFGNRKSLLFSGRTRPGDPLRWQADIGALSAYGYRPSISFEEGANAYCEWFKRNVLMVRK